MMDIIIRGLEKNEIMKLNRLASARKLSREEYLRRMVNTHLLAGDIKAAENKYSNLVQVMADAIQANSDKLEEMNRLIYKLIEEESKND